MSGYAVVTLPHFPKPPTALLSISTVKTWRLENPSSSKSGASRGAGFGARGLERRFIIAK
ncbi:hypothetical protein PT974_05234 [Cladobotryum mycophilum]|uniref:Uncharacterized protein n=1 Tax=Cladobotryum mycophilum TaxID=491253 RepID=A0ABR0SI87_9HYPO